MHVGLPCFLRHVILFGGYDPSLGVLRTFNTYRDESEFPFQLSARRSSPRRGPLLDEGGLKPSLLRLPQLLDACGCLGSQGATPRRPAA